MATTSYKIDELTLPTLFQDQRPIVLAQILMNLFPDEDVLRVAKFWKLNAETTISTRQKHLQIEEEAKKDILTLQEAISSNSDAYEGTKDLKLTMVGHIRKQLTKRPWQIQELLDKQNMRCERISEEITSLTETLAFFDQVVEELVKFCTTDYDRSQTYGGSQVRQQVLFSTVQDSKLEFIQAYGLNCSLVQAYPSNSPIASYQANSTYDSEINLREENVQVELTSPETMCVTLKRFFRYDLSKVKMLVTPNGIFPCRLVFNRAYTHEKRNQLKVPFSPIVLVPGTKLEVVMTDPRCTPDLSFGLHAKENLAIQCSEAMYLMFSSFSHSDSDEE